jgi:hypothetical protein
VAWLTTPNLLAEQRTVGTLPEDLRLARAARRHEAVERVDDVRVHRQDGVRMNLVAAMDCLMV